MGASLTMAFKTGTLWPVFPNVRRAEAPRKFWIGVAFYSFWVAGFVVGLLFFLMGWAR